MVSIPAVSPPLDEITTNLLDLLDLSGRTRAAGQGFDGAYGGDPVNPVFPHWILYQIPGGSPDPMPDLDLNLDTVTAVWQVTAVAKVRNQAQQLQRVLRDLLLARDGPTWTYPLAMPGGWVCIDRRPDATLAGVDRTGDPPNAIFTAPSRFYLTISPA